jgi:hypothetical protein
MHGSSGGDTVICVDNHQRDHASGQSRPHKIDLRPVVWQTRIERKSACEGKHAARDLSFPLSLVPSDSIQSRKTAVSLVSNRPVHVDGGSADGVSVPMRSGGANACLTINSSFAWISIEINMLTCPS